MNRGSFTNFEELERHLKDKFNNMMKSNEMTMAGKRASKAMGRHVLDELSDGGASGYDYDQTGDFHKLMSEEYKDSNIHQAKTSMSMGFGDIYNLNGSIDAKRNFQTQRHWIGSRTSGRYITVRLDEEKEMPKWIIAEFGAGNLADKSFKKYAKDFQVTYTKRPNKEFLFGPSNKKVRGVPSIGKDNKAISGTADEGNKKGYFMIGKKGLRGLYGNNNKVEGREHPGIKEGRIFRRGLERSKEDVREILANGIQNYLDD